jgi:hypothetical protein
MTLSFQINYDVLSIVTIGYLLFFVSLYSILALIKLVKRTAL